MTTASPEGARVDGGWILGPLGVVVLWPAGAERRAAPTWEVVHLATGHAVIEVVGGLRAAQGAAEGLLALGDWTFTSMDGWRNADPELVGRVRAWVAGRSDLQLAGGPPRLEAAAAEIRRRG